MKKSKKLTLIQELEKLFEENYTPYVQCYEPGIKSILHDLLRIVKKHKRKTRQPQ